MNKISLIIKREFLTRVKKKSFVIMTILGPLLMAALFIVPIYIADISDEVRTVEVLDETGLFFEKFENSETLKFEYIYTDIYSAKENFSKTDHYAILYIPRTELKVPNSAFLYSDKTPNIHIKSYIKDVIRKEIESLKLAASGIDENVLKSIKSSVNLKTFKITDEGNLEKSSSEVSMVLGLFSGILIYFFIFLFGAQVMRGVIEEKTNRIVEVIVSSVKPFQLMMGKIIGVALVGLTQLLLWVVLTFTIITVVKTAFPETFSKPTTEHSIMQSKIPGQEMLNNNTLNDKDTEITEDKVNQVLQDIYSINFGVIIFSFVFFFIGGYLLYAALFAAIGSAVDNETDTQQFMLPITVPLIFSILMAQFITANLRRNIQNRFQISLSPLRKVGATKLHK
jgi:ABC-2 type transport system permease protein